MGSAKLCSLVLLAVAVDAQLVFMFPQKGDEPDQIQRSAQPDHMTFRSVSAMGSDGRMHTETHKVFTQTSDDGLQKRIAEVDCKDGDCSKSVSHFFRGFPGMMSSMAPSNFFKHAGMPRMGMGMPAMHQKMHSMMMGGEEEAPGFGFGMHEKVKAICERMRHMHKMMHGHMHKMMHGHMMHDMHPHFLAPRIIQVEVVPESATAGSVQGVAVPQQAEDLTAMDVYVGLLGLFAVVGVASIGILSLRNCLAEKAQARERPLQELGQPLAPEAQAELGMAAGGVVVRPQAVAEAAKMPAAPTPTQMYLLDVYARAGKPADAAELATVVLRDVYAQAVARVTAA